MSNLQMSFNKFHENIRLELDDKDTLREKRSEVEEVIQDNIQLNFKYSFFDQGSYSTHTGIKPLTNEDYDIDRGMIIQATEDELSPGTAKKAVFDALIMQYGEENVRVKVPCITVEFPKDNVHVDIAIYREENDSLYLCKGKLKSQPENKCWEIADPKSLKEKINKAQNTEEDRKQFRRIIRYLKRWKDLKFKGQDNRPTGIGISVFAIDKFTPEYLFDSITYENKYDDALCLKKFVNKMINGFSWESGEEDVYERLKVFLPTEPYSDVYQKVSENQMRDFKKKLTSLHEALEEALNMSDLHESTTLLQKYFGEDFEITSQEKTAKAFNQTAVISDTPSA
ncbi:nucleotidyltransferase [Marinilactibacillus sp. Marseille-P9653]|uniref:nucleotidyltransferase domain-containing protein n=1 Tax=Marinilactibacillus sp. Marseille-P9653 TaxID=2866583 RepID=UPI001CE3D554|nr:nucleotidyltransferase [Marinilactibacillus sp. Marseille-P9653]